MKGKDLDGFERKAPPPLLQRGSTGRDVRLLQDRLMKAGFMAQADVLTGPGVFGPRTEQAVRRFQESVGLVATGVAGPTTMAALTSRTRFVGASKDNKDITATQRMPVAEVRTRLSQGRGTEETTERTNPMLEAHPID